MSHDGGPTDLSPLWGAHHLFQTELWGRFKAEYGWQPRAVLLDVEGGEEKPTLALFRRIGPIAVCYVPYPLLPSVLTAATLKKAATQVCAQTGFAPLYVRFDLLQESSTLPAGPAVRKARVDVQPPATVVLDLAGDEESLLASMHKKNRYNIGLAQRKGVKVRGGRVDEIGAWYDLYRETAARDRISIHPAHYYRRLFELAAEYQNVDLYLYVAEIEHQLLAGIIVAHFAGEATYLYGASSNEGRNLMPNYALQWHAITNAKSWGCTTYDLFGVPPGDDPIHPMHGLYRFKTGFGGLIVRRLGSWDVVMQPGRYAGYRLLESARDYYHHNWKKRNAR